MHIINHRKAIVRALIRSLTVVRAYFDTSFISEKTKLAFRPSDQEILEENEEHKRGCTVCVATKLMFVDRLSEMVTTSSNYGDLWMGLWLDEPVILHDGENSESRTKAVHAHTQGRKEGRQVALSSYYHGNTLFPRWLADVLNQECQLGIKDEDIYEDCTADLGHPCDAGGEDENGRVPCRSCAVDEKASMEDARRSWDVASPAEKNPEQYERDMIDAGRGHLLPRR